MIFEVTKFDEQRRQITTVTTLNESEFNKLRNIDRMVSEIQKSENTKLIYETHDLLLDTGFSYSNDILWTTRPDMLFEVEQSMRELYERI